MRIETKHLIKASMYIRTFAWGLAIGYGLCSLFSVASHINAIYGGAPVCGMEGKIWTLFAFIGYPGALILFTTFGMYAAYIIMCSVTWLLTNEFKLPGIEK